jgi:hypothetical protein
MCVGKRCISVGAVTSACLAVLATPLAVWAARDVEVSITVDGRDALYSEGADDGHAYGAKAWRRLTRWPLYPMRGFKVPTDPDRPGWAVLRGKIRISAVFGGAEQWAEVRELHLKKGPARKGHETWLIPKGEVRRTLKFRTQKRKR